MNINQKRKSKSIFRLLNWSKFSRSKKAFCFAIWKWNTTNKLQIILSPGYYNVKIDRQIFFDQPVRNNLIASDNIRKIAATLGDDYRTGCFVDYNYFKSYYNMIGKDLIKQQVLDADPKAIWINFTGNLKRQARIFFIIKGAKETVLDLSQGTVKVF